MSGEKEKTEISTVTATSTGISTGGGGVLTGVKVKREGSLVSTCLAPHHMHTSRLLANSAQTDVQDFDDQLGDNVEQYAPTFVRMRATDG